MDFFTRRRNLPLQAHSGRRHTLFLVKRLAWKPDLASPEDQQYSDNLVCEKELEITGLVCDSSSVSMYLLFFNDIPEKVSL